MGDVPRRRLRILFSMRNCWYVRIFESVIRGLASQGHLVHILAEHDPDPVPQWTAAATALAAESPNVTVGYARRSLDDPWLDLRVMTRLGRDYLRFLEPRYRATPILASRARARVPARVARLAERGPAARALLRRVLGMVERAIPEDPEIAAAVTMSDGVQPDVVLVTPLVDLGSDQHDVLRAARARGIPSALCVGSWDHLSSKGVLRDHPDRIFVWNETQQREAVELHDAPPQSIVVTGAQCFDHWFDRRPSLDRGEFCRKVGLDSNRPYVLYVCSALFEGSPNEAEFVRRWIAAARETVHPELRDAGILIRPHPKRAFEWDGADLSAWPNVRLWPPRAAAPMDSVTKSDYFDSLYHSACVVGLNTSALIEAGIVGRAVHTILLPEFTENQEGTLHFRYLIDGGLLRTSRDLDEHVAQLAASVRGRHDAVDANRAFIETFVRPHGLQTTGTTVFIESIEQLAAVQPAPARAPWWRSPLRAALTPVARRAFGTFAEHEARERRYREKQQTRDARIAALEAQRTAEKAQLLEERRLRHEAARTEREAAKARARAEQLAARQQEVDEKRRRTESRLAEWQREKRKRAINARIAAYWRRVARAFSPQR